LIEVYEQRLKWVTRQTIGRVVGIIPFIVEELLQQIDLDYYRSARLLSVHAELEQLRQERPTSGDLERRRCPRIDVGAEDVSLTTRRAARLVERVPCELGDHLRRYPY
jgi:hypothetical protein